MKIISGSQFHIEEKTAIAFGKFDGIHLGHRKLLREVLHAARTYGLKSLVFTFDPSPLIFFGDGSQKELSTVEEKRRIFEELGFDYLIEFTLNKQTAATPPEDFVRNYLVKMMNAAMIFSGDDVSFGDKGAGNYLLLRRMSSVYGYEMQVVDKLFFEGTAVSSTVVRGMITEGRVEEATDLLSGPYELRAGTLSPMMLRSEKGYKVMYFRPEKEKLLPKSGCYEVRIYAASDRPENGEHAVLRVPEDNGSLCLIFDPFDVKFYGHVLHVQIIRKSDTFFPKIAIVLWY